MQLNNDIVTFDPQTCRFIDGKRLTFGSDIHLTGFQRPNHSFSRAPDDRLFLYGADSATATEGTFF
ncbi:MAG: hypothetical protein ACI8W8_002871, partial [Rhodothermales bacterium]